MSGKFRYKDYEFRYNPREFTITRERNLLKFIVPEQDSVIQDMGYEPAVISGIGELLGDNVMDEYVKIQNIFNNKDSGLLYIPDLSPINCYFNKLKIIGKAGPKVLTYNFEFVENHKTITRFTGVIPKYIITTGGESLHTISLKHGVTLDSLIAKNYHIINIEKIPQGVTVWL